MALLARDMVASTSPGQSAPWSCSTRATDGTSRGSSSPPYADEKIRDPWAAGQPSREGRRPRDQWPSGPEGSIRSTIVCRSRLAIIQRTASRSAKAENARSVTPNLERPNCARPVVDPDLHDAEPRDPEQRGHESVHPHVRRHRAHARPAHHPQATRAVLHRVPGDRLADPVGNPRRDPLEPRIPPKLPPADHRIGLAEVRHQHPEVARIVLQVAVHGGHEAAPRGLKPRVERRAQTGILGEADHADARVVLGEPSEDVVAPVRRPVVHEDHLGGRDETRQDRGQLAPEDRQALDLVVHRQHQRERDLPAHGRATGAPTSTRIPLTSALSTTVHACRVATRSGQAKSSATT